MAVGTTQDVRIRFSVVTKGAPGFEKATQKMTKSLGRLNKEQLRFRVMTAGLRRNIGALRNQILIVTFALAGFVRAISNTVKNANKLQAALVGLQSVARNVGESISGASKVAKDLAATGLVSVTQASASLKNLLATGIGLDKATDLLYAFTDAASFGRQGTLSLGEALEGATQGYKNMLSMLLDNSGITRNLSLMEKEYARTIGKTVGVLTEAERRMAHYVGIMKDAKMFEGDRLKLMGLLTGQLSKLSTVMFNLSAAIGRVLQPALTVLVRRLVLITKQTKLWVDRNKELIETEVLHFLGVFNATLQSIVTILRTLFMILGKIYTTFPVFIRSLLPALATVAAGMKLIKLTSISASIGVAKLTHTFRFLFRVVRRFGIVAGVVAFLTKPTLLLVAAVALLFAGIKKLVSFLDRHRRAMLELNRSREKELRLIREKNEAKIQEISSELESIQIKINLKGRIQDLVDKEGDLIEKIKERSRLQRISLIKEAESRTRAILQEKGVRAAIEKFVTPPVVRTSIFGVPTGRKLGIGRGGITAELEQLARMSESDIMEKARLRGTPTGELDNILRAVESKLEEFAARKLELKIVEPAKLLVEIMEKADEKLRELIATTNRSRTLTQVSNEVIKKELQLYWKRNDAIDAVNASQSKNEDLKKTAIHVIQQEYDEALKLLRVKKDELTFLEKLAEIDKKFRKAERVTAVTGSTRGLMDIERQRYQDVRDLLIEHKMDVTQIEENHLLKMYDLSLRDFERKKELLRRETTLRAKFKLTGLEADKHIANIMENISTAFFREEIRRQLTLQKVTGSVAYEVLAVQLDALKQYAQAKSMQFAAEVFGQLSMGNIALAGYAAKAAAGFGALAGVASAAAGEARSRASEHIAGGGVTDADVTEVAGGAGGRNYGVTTQLPVQNITIAPSVTINSGGGSIMVTGGGAEVLEREIAEMVVKAIEDSVRSQEIDLVGVGRR